MIDVLLFDSLLKALRLSCRIILVGDSDQLPSIGAGNLLNDILTSGIFPSIRLKKVFRQAGRSRIITNAHAIINGMKPDFSAKDSDCFFMHRADRYSVSRTVLELVCERLPAAYGFDPVKDIQVLCPSRLLETGTVNLNNMLQSALNPHTSDKPQLPFKGIFFREGDKVMQVKNNYDICWESVDNKPYGVGIYNGDLGIISKIDAEGVEVIFDNEKKVNYDLSNLEELEHAYAITVHKSQGSEFPVVVLPIVSGPPMLYTRNLLYTAVTRAKELLVILGNEKIVQYMINNVETKSRNTGLRFKMSKYLDIFNG